MFCPLWCIDTEHSSILCKCLKRKISLREVLSADNNKHDLCTEHSPGKRERKAPLLQHRLYAWSREIERSLTRFFPEQRRMPDNSQLGARAAQNSIWTLQEFLGWRGKRYQY